MSALVLIHVLSLDTVGGVETLYVSYLKETAALDRTIHYTCVSGKRPHHRFAEQLAQHAKPYLEQYLLGVRLPRWLRVITNIRRGIIEDLVKPSAWVFWNRIEEKLPPGRAVYYEHGAAWTVRPTNKRKAFLQHCASFIANSEAAATMLRLRWGVSAPITVVPNPLRPEVPIRAEPRSRPAGALRLGFIGRFVPIKNPLLPLYVLKDLLDKKIPASLSMAGEGPQEAAVRQTIRKLAIGSNVQLIGCVANVGAWLDSIDVLLVPSVREPLGLVALEASARGVPVLATRVDGLPEIVANEESGFLIEPTIAIENGAPFLTDLTGIPEVVVDPERGELVKPKLISPDACLKALCRLLEEPGLYERLSMNGLARARSRASFSSYCDSLKSLLANVPEEAE